MNTRTLVEAAIMIALTAVTEIIFTNLNIAIFPNGGSISIAALPIMIFSLRHGWKYGMVVGTIFGLFQFILPMGVYFLTPVQYLFDYVLPYTALGFMGFTKVFTTKVVTLNAVITMLFKYASHVIAGFVFWGEYAPEGFSALSWSFYYNATYLVPSLILVAIIMYVITKSYKKYIIVS